MSKKDYERAASIAQAYDDEVVYPAVIGAFCTLFKLDGNPRFDEARFRRACLPGANVRARS